jgi:hypothetical protein
VHEEQARAVTRHLDGQAHPVARRDPHAPWSPESA